MSHTTSLKGVNIRSVPALRAAVAFLQAQGVSCTLIENATPRAYYTQQEGMGLADFVLRLDAAKYDVGLYRQADGTYEARTDFFMDSVEKVLGVPRQPGYQGDQYKLGRLFQAYAMTAAEERARQQGLMVTRQLLPDGRIKLLATGF